VPERKWGLPVKQEAVGSIPTPGATRPCRAGSAPRLLRAEVQVRILPGARHPPAKWIGPRPPKAGLGVRIAPGGLSSCVMRPVSQAACLVAERGSTPLRRATRGRGANGDAVALRAAWPGIVPRRPHNMAAYPNLRQRDHVENVFSIGSNPIAATTPGYPNQQRTPAQTRCVAGANPVPGTGAPTGA
jgi:hypothetical protein